MDEIHRQLDLQAEIMEVSNKAVNVMLEKTGTNVFNACKEWDYEYPRPALVPSQGTTRIHRILGLSRGLLIPTAQIPEVWEILAGHLAGKQEVALVSALRVFDKACYGVGGPQENTFEVLVRFLYLAAKQYEDEGLITLNQPYQIMLGPPGAGRIGVRESLVHSAKKTQRVTGVLTLPRIIGKPFGSPIKPGWELSSLARHVNHLSPSVAKRLTTLYSALPLPDKDLRKLILSSFKVNNLDYDEAEVVAKEDAVDAEALALLNQLSEMYV